MADIEEILRLMNHAADLLEEQDGTVTTAFRFKALTVGSTDIAKAQAIEGLSAYAAASGLAQATLRLVASFMTDGSPTDGD